MRKKCVRWTSPVRNPLVAAAIILALPLLAAAQSTDPSTLPLLAAESIQYTGAFRLPAQSTNGDSFAVGGRPMAFNPARHSLFIGSRAGRVAEIAIPSLGNSADVNALPFASYLQPFADPTEGHLSQIAGEGVALDGLLIVNNRLYGTASIYYDAINSQRVSHYSHSLQLNQASFAGWSSVWDPAKTGFVSGAMAAVPAEWQSRLGGPAITSTNRPGSARARVSNASISSGRPLYGRMRPISRKTTASGAMPSCRRACSRAIQDG